MTAIDQNELASLENFFIAGISHKKTDAATRGMFAVNDEQYDRILALAPSYGVDELFIISTCNRTEIYGLADTAEQLTTLLISQTVGDNSLFLKQAYIKKGTEAIDHLFNVGAGLDSQILGDYEIVGQIKQAIKFSKERGRVRCFLERLINEVLQSSKEVKNETALSGGTVSVSFAAIQYLKKHVNNFANKRVLVLGIGKIGRNTCKNLVDYLNTTNITLINRSENKAKQLAAELNLQHAPLEELQQHIRSADIIIVATNGPEPTILKSDLYNSGQKLIIDLSIPYNVEPSADDLPGITLANVDQISKMRDATMSAREFEVPKAKEIIKEHVTAFEDWHLMRQNAPRLKAIKILLHDIAKRRRQELDNYDTRCPYIAAEQQIQKIINKIAGKMRVQSQPVCYHLEAVNEFIETTKH